MNDLAVFSARLLPGERLVWTGRPMEGLRFRALDWLLIPFSLMWGGFALFWEAGVLGVGLLGVAKGSAAAGGVGLFMSLWGVPFVAVGFFMIFGRFIADAWLRAGMTYALTDQRVIIDRRRGGRSLQMVELTRDLRLSELRRDGRGTIVFGPETDLLGWGMRRDGFSLWLPALTRRPEFAGIADAERVFDLAQRQIADRQRR